MSTVEEASTESSRSSTFSNMTSQVFHRDQTWGNRGLDSRFVLEANIKAPISKSRGNSLLNTPNCPHPITDFQPALILTDYLKYIDRVPSFHYQLKANLKLFNPNIFRSPFVYQTKSLGTEWSALSCDHLVTELLVW